MSVTSTIQKRAKEALAFAEKLCATGLHWQQIHNALFGVDGKCTELFPSAQDRAAFVKSRQFTRIGEMLNALPRPPVQKGKTIDDVSGRILVRVPRSLHAALLAESELEGVSLNQLCVAKLAVPLPTGPVAVRKGA
jgi:hypothetical protein